MHKVDNPIKLYEQAQNSYDSSKYIDAILRFEHLNKTYPKFEKRDESEYLVANSYEKLGLNDSAFSKYTQISDSESISLFQPNSMLGMMNIYYKNGYYGATNELEREMKAKYPNSSVMSEMYYIRGQIEYRERRFRKSINYFASVTDSSFVPYALFTKAQCYRGLRKDSLALNTLQELFDMKVQDSAQQILIYKGHLLAGHILQDQNRVKEGMNHYMLIPGSLEFNDEAYFALAWCFLKYNKPEGALGYTSNLINFHENSIYVTESYMIKGVAEHLNHNFSKAIEHYDTALVLLEKLVDTKANEKREKSFYKKVSRVDSLLSEVYFILNSVDYTKDSIQSRSDSLKEKMKAFEMVNNEIINIAIHAREIEAYSNSYRDTKLYLKKMKYVANLEKEKQEKLRILEEEKRRIREEEKCLTGCCYGRCADEDLE